MSDDTFDLELEPLIPGLRIEPRHASGICPNIAKGRPCSPCDEVADIDRKIALGDGDLPTLLARSKVLKTQMNNLHDTLSAQLPMEITSKIFLELVTDNMDQNFSTRFVMDTQTTPLLLGAVSRRWRAIAWSDPRLWNAISVNICNGHLGLEQIVRDWLSRSGALPLYVHIFVGRRQRADFTHADSFFSPYFEEQSDSTQLIHTMNSYSQRWTYLDLRLPSRYMLLVNSAPVRPQSLKTLTLAVDAREEAINLEKITIGRTASLERLSIKYIDPSLIDVDWSRLIYFEALDIPSNASLEVFPKAPLLRCCILDDIRPRIKHLSGIRHRLEYLTYLRVHGNDVATVLAYLDLPALSEFELDRNSDWFPPDVSFLVSFLHRTSSCGPRRLICVKILGSEYTSQRFMEFFSKLEEHELLNITSNRDGDIMFYVRRRSVQNCM